MTEPSELPVVTLPSLPDGQPIYGSLTEPYRSAVAAAASATDRRAAYLAVADAAHHLATFYRSLISLDCASLAGPEYPASLRLFEQSRAYRAAALREGPRL